MRLGLLIDFVDVEDGDAHRGGFAEQIAPLRPILAGDEHGRVLANSAMPLKTYFGVPGVKSAISLS